MSDMRNLNFDGRLNEVVSDHKNLHDKIWKLQRGEIGILEVLKLVNKIREDEMSLIDLVCEHEITNDIQKGIEIPKWVNRD